METFNVTFKENWWKTKKSIITKYKINNVFHTILYYFGCLPVYGLEIVSEPERVYDGYEYKVELKTKTYRLFGFNIKTVKL